MKKYIKLIAIIMICVVCSGCVKFDGSATINSFKKMSFHIDYGLLKELNEYNALSDDEINVMKDYGCNISKYNNKDYKGYSIDYVIKNIDNVSDKDEVEFSLTSLKKEKPSKVFKVDKSFFTNKYVATFIFDSTDITPQYINDDNVDTIKYLCDDGKAIEVKKNDPMTRSDCHRVSNIELNNAISSEPLSSEELEKKYNAKNDLKFTINLNSSALKNNADKVSNNGKKLVWKLNSNGITKINFEFREINYFNCLSVIIILLIPIVLIIVLIKYKKKLQ